MDKVEICSCRFVDEGLLLALRSGKGMSGGLMTLPAALRLRTIPRRLRK